MIQQRFQMIFPSNELDRIRIFESDKIVRIIVDVHGLSCKQARRLINNVILVPRTNFHLIVIHGFNRGTAIKDMLVDNFDNCHISTRNVDPRNQGVTHMQIAA